MHRIDVAERRRAHDDVVPGRLAAIEIGNRLEGEVRGHPGRILTAAERRRALDDVRRQECRRGENHGVADIVGFPGANAERGLLAPYRTHRLSRADESPDALEQPLDDPAVALRPGQRAFLVVVA